MCSFPCFVCTHVIFAQPLSSLWTQSYTCTHFYTHTNHISEKTNSVSRIKPLYEYNIIVTLIWPHTERSILGKIQFWNCKLSCFSGIKHKAEIILKALDSIKSWFSDMAHNITISLIVGFDTCWPEERWRLSHDLSRIFLLTINYNVLSFCN